MNIIFKEYITRPSLDSIFVFEFEFSNELKFQSWLALSKIKPTSYLEFITWREVIARKEEIRPDLKFYLDRLGLFNKHTKFNLDDGPMFNYFSLTFTQVTAFDSIESFEHLYEFWKKNILNTRKKNLEICSNTRNEELWIDGQLVPLVNS